MSEFKRWDVWWANFKYQESDIFKDRPVIILEENNLTVLSIKLTTKEPREYDPLDYKIQFWEEANLRKPSTARISKVAVVSKMSFRKYIGRLVLKDILQIQNLIKFSD